MKCSRSLCCYCCFWITLLLVATTTINASSESISIANENFDNPQLQKQKIQPVYQQKDVVSKNLLNQTAIKIIPSASVMSSLATVKTPTTQTTTATMITTELAIYRIIMELMRLKETSSIEIKAENQEINKRAATTMKEPTIKPIRTISRSTNKSNKFSQKGEELSTSGVVEESKVSAVVLKQQELKQQNQQIHFVPHQDLENHQTMPELISPTLQPQKTTTEYSDYLVSKQRNKRQAIEEQSDKCRLFNEGDEEKYEFYSPDYPNDYPKNINCTRIIVAPKGQVIRLDFRNSFHIEAKEDCKFDFLEIRDGQYGFSNLLGKFCGTDFPPEITSQERYLWLHFHSDESIEYSGFTAVYEFIDRRRETPSTDLNCTIEKDGYEGFVNSSDIPKEIKKTAETNKIPLDCIWRIQVKDKWKIQVKFLEFKLIKPNDCETNFLDIFPEETVMPLRLKNFCGSAGEGIGSESNILHVRFYAEKEAINSTFSILFTAYRDKTNTGCTHDEYDCEDATCISADLMCNKRDNCKFRWDELDERCLIASNGQSEHVIIIIIVFGLLLGGMVITFLVNCTRKIMRDQKIIREHIRQSKESELNEMGRHSKARSRDDLSIAMSPRQKHSQTSLQILDDVSNRYYRDVVPITVQTNKSDLKEKEHSILRQHHDMFVQTSLVCDDSSSTTTATATEPLPIVGSHVCNMACQTRDSLFVTEPIREKSISPHSEGMVIPTPPRFSTFGYDTQQHPPPPPPPAIKTLSRQAMRVPAAFVGSIELEPTRHHFEDCATHPRASHTAHHSHTSGVYSASVRPQETCHHHHQHQQYHQHQQQQHHQQQREQTQTEQHHLTAAVTTIQKPSDNNSVLPNSHRDNQKLQHHYHQHQYQQQQHLHQQPVPPQMQTHQQKLQQQQQKQTKCHQSTATIPTMPTLAAKGTITTATTTSTTTPNMLATTPMTGTTPAPAGGKNKHHKMEETKVFLDVRNSAPDVIIMTSH